MPVESCQLNNKPGYRWGNEGKCYTYDPSSPSSESKAKAAANAQGIAIIRSGGDASKYAVTKISFDYDDTLSTDKGKNLAKEEIAKGNIVYIISARDSRDGILGTATELGIPDSRVYATGSNKAKVEKIKELGINKHYDNNPDVISELGDIGTLFS